jgi:hypothetical protein
MDTQQVERYIINLGLTYEEIDEGTWLINDIEKGLKGVVVSIAEPLIVIRVNVTQIPKNNKEAFYLKLLQLNGSDLVHGAYAISENNVILIDTLQVNTLDFEEFQASLDAISLALAQHFPILSDFFGK